MTKLTKVSVAYAVLAFVFAADCHAVNYVQDPTTEGPILVGQAKIQCSGGATTGGLKRINWKDGSGFVVDFVVVNTAPMSPFSWAGEFTLARARLTAWKKGTGDCRMSVGGTPKTPTIVTSMIGY